MMLKGTVSHEQGGRGQGSVLEAASWLHSSVWIPGHSTRRLLCKRLMNELNGKCIARLWTSVWPPPPLPTPIPCIPTAGTFQGSRKLAVLPGDFLTYAEPNCHQISLQVPKAPLGSLPQCLPP